MSTEELTAAVTVPQSGVFAWVMAHPVLSILIAVLALILILVLIRLFFRIIRIIRNRRETSSIKKDLMIWSLISSLVQGGRKTDKAKAELNTKLRSIDLIFSRAHDILRSQRHISSKRPLFVLLGEPTCGKSRLIENSGLDYRCTEKDEQQKPPVRFFYNQNSVIADVSGKVFFDNWLGGSSAEWSHICSLLGKRRGSKPVSGVILTISAEALLADDRRLTQKKAALISSELSRLTGTLRMKLPCFVVITKLDAVPGFREYFANLDENARNQIVGFQPLADSGVFEKDDFDAFFDSLVERLGDGAVALMSGKKVLELAYSGRPRMGLTGGIYLFARNLSLIRGSLEFYLDTVFGSRRAEGEGTALFRGVFLTSAEDRGLSLSARFAELQQKSIDDAPLHDPNFKGPGAYFIPSLVSKLIVPSASAACFTREEQLRRRIPAMALCGALFAASCVLWYGALVKGPQLTARLQDDTLYYQRVGRQFRRGEIGAAPLLGVDARGSGVMMLKSPMPNDSRVTRIGFFSEAQRRLLKKTVIPWQFFPASFLSFGFEGEPGISERASVYNQIQTKMAFLPAVESLEYNFIMKGDEPYTRKKRDALFELMKMALFLDRHASAVNDQYSGSTMASFIDYLYPGAGKDIRKQLADFRPDYDYLAGATNSEVVLSNEYGRSLYSAITGFAGSWKRLENYPEEEYAILRKDIRSASGLIQLYENVMGLRAVDFSTLETDEMQRILDGCETDAEKYGSYIADTDNMMRLADVDQDVSSSLKPAAGKGGKGKDREQEGTNQYGNTFEKAFRAYRDLLAGDYDFLKDYDSERRSSGASGIDYGGVDFGRILSEHAGIEKSLDDEYRKLSETIVSVQQSPLFDLTDPANPAGGYNYSLFGKMLKASMVGIPDGRFAGPADVRRAMSDVRDDYDRRAGELAALADAGEKSPLTAEWNKLCRKIMSARYNLAMIRVGQQFLLLYPDSGSDMKLLADLTVMVAGSGTRIGDFAPGISLEMMRGVLGPFELRDEYSPGGFIEYAAPLAKMHAIMKDGKNGNELFARRLSSNEKFRRLLRVFSKYAGSYINYWGHLADSLHMQADSYAEFYQKAAGLKAYQVNSQLQDLYSLSMDAVSRADDGLLDDNVKSLKAATLKRLDSRVKGIDVSFTDECNEVLTAWSVLTGDATYANRKVMGMSDKELRSSILSLGKGVIPWWSEFTSLGTKLLKRDASSEATLSLALFQDELKFFPLVKDGDVRARILSKNDLKRLMVMFSSFGLTDASKTEAPDELAGFGLDPEKNLKVADDIRGPLVFSEDSGKQADFKIWAGMMEKLLTALSSDSKNMQFVITRVDAASQHRLAAEQGFGGYESGFARYRYFDVTIGSRPASTRLPSFVSKPDKDGISGGVISNDEIVFNFYRFSDSEEPDCTYRIDGAYPSLQLYLSSSGIYDEETKQVTLPLILTDKSGASSIFYIGIRNKSGLPLPSDWPSLEDWPDVSLFRDFGK